MKKMAAIILFIGCIIGVAFCLYGVIDSYVRWRDYESDSAKEDILLIALTLTPLLSGIYYVIATKFGSLIPTVLDSLERENEIIRKKIERTELLAKVEKLENTDQ